MAKSKFEGSRRCWHCGRQLMTKKGGGYTFATVKDQIGNISRVHKNCVKKAIGDGVREVKDA